MALVNNLKELRQLMDRCNLSVNNTEQLRDLLLTVQLTQSEDPALHQAFLAQKERELASRDRARALDHEEWMRALELGHPLPDPDSARAQAGVLKAAAAGASFLAILVTLGTVGISVGATGVMVTRLGPESVGPLCVLWVLVGVVCLVTVGAALYVLHHLRLDLHKVRRPGPPPQPAPDGLSAVVLPVEKPLVTQSQYRER